MISSRAAAREGEETALRNEAQVPRHDGWTSTQVRAAPPPSPLFGIIISTIGRGGPLRVLLHSLATQSLPRERFAVVVCAQGAYDEVHQVCKDVSEETDLTVNFVASDTTGVSSGRNLGDQVLAEDVQYLLFPNDTTIYPPDFLLSLEESIDGAPAAAVVVRDQEGPKAVLPPDGFPLDRRDVWAALAPGMVVQRWMFRVLGGFDETLGTGARTPWQSGEETDFLLRYLDRFGGQEFRWIGHLWVHGPSDGQDLSPRTRRQKLRAYGRGYGRVLARHGFGWGRRARGVVGGALFGFRHRPHFSAIDGWWVTVGRLEGMAGRTVPSCRSCPARAR